mmetsp:Transcript_9509/g.21819  ORF Transcript_9509/g.21819 Transcript_9509/m.21819 type:complete len:257 (-) Transcript_9509:1002-1772(-)
MELIDTHAHLYSQEFAADIANVVARSKTNHVCKIYMPNIDVNSIDAMLTFEAQHPNLVAAMIGLHPCCVGRDFEKQLATVETWLAKRSFAAIGEIGIDLYKDTTYQTQQEEAFVAQLKWAQQYQLPVTIHCRGRGMSTVLQLLEKHQDGHLKGIVHCFSGSLQEAEHIIALGFYLGIGGLVTFKNIGLDKLVATLDLHHLVLETDAPYLAPTPYRGQRNEPAYLMHIARKLATIKEVTLETVAKVTTTNAVQVFKH